MPRATPPIETIAVRRLRFPTDAPEADGTMAWDHTTMVLAEISAGGETGSGYTYASEAAADVIKNLCVALLRGRSAFDIPAHWMTMVGAVRNMGWRGVCADAISAVDVALS